RYFSSLVQDFPTSNLVPDAYYALGSSYQEEASFNEAIDFFRKVGASGPSDLAAQAGIAIADIYARQNKLSEALAEYHMLAQAYPHLSGIIYPKIAEVLEEKGDLQEALALYRKSLDMVPVKEMASVQFKIAQTLQSQGQSDEAIEEYLKVTYLYSDNKELATKALLRVAQLYEDKEKFKEAISIYRRIISDGVAEAAFAQERVNVIEKQLPLR
ncbi:MAG: tetratricopeptide repeat protein, partial [Candidatus Omnitrophica bacterium]|nr:tetratricopeptide repeat protein [Candidatus Omnitrophota bacterium]